MRIPSDREMLELLLKEPHAFGIIVETPEGRELYRKAEFKHWRLYGRKEYEETHKPIVVLPENEVKWLEETGRIHIVERIPQKNPSYTMRDGKEVECVEVQVASWSEVRKAYKMVWAKFQLPKYRKR